MNPTIVKIIDMMFRGVPENEETNAMREELLTNSQARFEDLVSSGVSTDDALGQVLDNLRGMEDVLDEYRTGKRTARAVPTLGGADGSSAFDRFERMAEEIDEHMERVADKVENTARNAFDSAMEGLRSAADSLSGVFAGNASGTNGAAAYRSAASLWQQDPEDEDLLEAVFSPAEYRRLSLQLVGEDVEAEPSPDGRIHVVIDKPDEHLYLLEAVGGQLTLRHDPDPVQPTSGDDDRNEELEGFSGIFSGITRALRGAFRRACTSGGTVRLYLPDGMEQITLQTASGDIDVESLCQPALTASTVSGDIDMTGCRFSGMVRLGSASGDVEVSDSTFTGGIALHSTSGDVAFNGIAPSVNTNNVSGDTELRGCFSQLRANSVSGDIDVTVQEDLQSLWVNSTSGDVDVSLPAKVVPNVKTSTTSGDVAIQAATDPNSHVSVQLNTVSGDIFLCNF